MARPAPVRRPAKVAHLLALADYIEAAIDAGTYKDRADAARQLGVTRPRISQIMDLALLAPDIQEAILFMEAVDGVEAVRERQLRGIVGDGGWEGQRGRWGGGPGTGRCSARTVAPVPEWRHPSCSGSTKRISSGHSRPVPVLEATDVRFCSAGGSPAWLWLADRAWPGLVVCAPGAQLVPRPQPGSARYQQGWFMADVTKCDRCRNDMTEGKACVGCERSVCATCRGDKGKDFWSKEGKGKGFGCRDCIRSGEVFPDAMFVGQIAQIQPVLERALFNALGGQDAKQFADGLLAQTRAEVVALMGGKTGDAFIKELVAQIMTAVRSLVAQDLTKWVDVATRTAVKQVLEVVHRDPTADVLGRVEALVPRAVDSALESAHKHLLGGATLQQALADALLPMLARLLADVHRGQDGRDILGRLEQLLPAFGDQLARGIVRATLPWLALFTATSVALVWIASKSLG